MLSKNDSCGCPQGLLRPFKYINIDIIPPESSGVYGFWFRKLCLYIGKAQNRALKTRLFEHWNGSHNPELNSWLAAKGASVNFVYLEIEKNTEIDAWERFYIKKYNPITNVIRYRSVREIA